MNDIDRLEKLAAQTPGLPWLTYEAGVSHVDGTDYLAISTADGNQDVIQSTNIGALAFMEPALAEVIVAAVNALPDLLKAARLAHETDIGCYRAIPVLSANRIEWADCGECPSCLLRAALEPLFREEGQG